MVRTIKSDQVGSLSHHEVLTLLQSLAQSPILLLNEPLTANTFTAPQQIVWVVFLLNGM